MSPGFLRFVSMLFLAWSGITGRATAQQPAATPTAVPQTLSVPVGGLQTPWDVRKTIADLQRDALQLQPLLAQISPQVWAEKKSAPTTYIVQWQSAQQQLNDLITMAKLFAQRTESLSQGMDVYFRLESIETAERSLAEGSQHYDTRQATDKLNALIAQNFTNREHLREYLRELATSTEQNFKIADQEAQRCRGLLSQQGLPPIRKAGKK